MNVLRRNSTSEEINFKLAINAFYSSSKVNP